MAEAKRKVGDRYQTTGINGHLYDRTVVAGPRSGIPVVESVHAAECRCGRTPWEFDPVDAY